MAFKRWDSEDDLKPTLQSPPTLDLERFRFQSSPRRVASVAAGQAIAAVKAEDSADATEERASGVHGFRRESGRSPSVKREASRAPTAGSPSAFYVLIPPFVKREAGGSVNAVKRETSPSPDRARIRRRRPASDGNDEDSEQDVASSPPKRVRRQAAMDSPSKRRVPATPSNRRGTSTQQHSPSPVDSDDDAFVDSMDGISDDSSSDARPPPSKPSPSKAKASPSKSTKKKKPSRSYADPSVYAHLGGVPDALEPGLRVGASAV